MHSMDSGGMGLDELGFGDLFAKDGLSGSMDLDALGSPSLPDLDSQLVLHQAVLGVPGHDLVATALRSHQGRADPPSLTVDEQNIRPRLQCAADNNAVAVTAAAPAPSLDPVPSALSAPTQFTIKPLPARKTAAVKPEPQPVELQQDAEFDSDSTEPSGRGGAKRRRRIRNAKQQELNRLAQQRYRERRKQKYSTLQGTVEELSGRISQLNMLEAANNELQQRNTQLEVVVKDQQAQLQVQKETITRQAQQLQTQAVQLSHQAKQLQAQVQVIQQQDKSLAELRNKVAATGSSAANGGSSSSGGSSNAPAAASVPDADQLNDQIALAVRAVLTGVSSMASVSFPPAKDSAQMQQMVSQLPDALLQQIRTCCREVALHLKKTEVKEQPHAISVPCC